MDVKTFPTHDVSAIGGKLDGVDGSSKAGLFGTSLMTADFHASGIVDDDQAMLKMCRRARHNAGHFLRIL